MSSASGSGARILAILDLFSEARPEWLPEDMMACLGYSRPTLYRYLKTLKDAGFLVSLPNQGFTLGPRVTELDFLMRRSDPLIAAAEPHLQALAARYPSSVFLTRWYGRKILCVASVVSAEAPKSSYPRGRPMPLGRGAISRVIAAALPRREQEAFLAEYLGDFAGGSGGRGRDEVRGELRAIRREGVAVAHGEVTPGVVGIAAPVLVAERAPIAALCITCNAAELDAARIAEIAADVKSSAAAISAELSAGRAGSEARERTA